MTFVAGCLALTALVISCGEEHPISQPIRASGAAEPAVRQTGSVAGGGESSDQDGRPTTQEWVAWFKYPPAVEGRKSEVIAPLNRNCVECHDNGKASAVMHSPDMHTGSHNITCVDCHGGAVIVPGSNPHDVKQLSETDPQFLRVKEAYHVSPRPETRDLWSKDPTKPNGQLSSANPKVPYARTLDEDINFIRFVNPGDLRVAHMACGACHNKRNDPQKVPIVDNCRKSMMAHGAMLWEAALYNNGAINRKVPIYGEAYTIDGIGDSNRQVPAKMQIDDPRKRPTAQETASLGWLPALFPIPRWEVSQPGNILRVFETGGKRRPIIGIPDPDEDPGRPDVKLSVRGYGTDVRTDPVFLGLQKTRLLDPTLNLFGTNDHPGDYRASGCSACHVVYANDNSSVHSSKWSQYKNRGESYSADKRVNPDGRTEPSATRPTTESGHPVSHVFVKNMPTSTCIVCHVHPGTNVLNSYLGYTWWDNETDGEFMYPLWQTVPTADDEAKVYGVNPEGGSVRGLWSNQYKGWTSIANRPVPADFLENLASGPDPLNKYLKHTQFADFHGHGWVFRAVFKQDRHGQALDWKGEPVQVNSKAMSDGVNAATQPFARPVGTIPVGAAAIRKKVAEQSVPPPEHAMVHLKDIHLEKGMHCVDCHFTQDAHGDGHLVGETRTAVMIGCVDCHGSATEPPTILEALEAKLSDPAVSRAFSGPAAASRTTQQLNQFKNVLGAHFKMVEFAKPKKGPTSKPVLFQVSAVDNPSGDKGWFIKTVTATTQPSPLWAGVNEKARYAHTVRKLPSDPKADKLEFGLKEKETNKSTGKEIGKEADRIRATRTMLNLSNGSKEYVDASKALDAMGGPLAESDILAHANSNVSCYACHSSWNTSCFGCHLSMRANQAKPMLHNEGQKTRNYTNYDFQTLRDDVYMLGIDSTAKNHAVVPVRSACAVLVSSQDANRQWIYSQQQTVSAEGLAGTSFSPYFPHTVRTRETKNCTDCHVSKDNDNNAIMAQLLMQGTNSVNFIGRYAWVAEEGEGLEAVAVTELDEPQAVIGSKLHRLAYPSRFGEHKERQDVLKEAHHHDGTVYDVQLRGEYLYAACGSEGFIAYDVANIENKGFSERIITAPVSPLGQRLYVRTKDARCIVSPSTLALDPTRTHLDENEENHVHPLYAYLYIADAQEGLVVIGNVEPDAVKRGGVGVSTLLDGNPQNNFLTKALSYNPNHSLDGATHMALHGHFAYICCKLGIAVVSLENPLDPKLETILLNKPDKLHNPRKIAFQFRYGFVVDEDGLKILDVTNPGNPRILDAQLKLDDARDIYVCRTSGYIAAGKDGLVIVDLENPELLKPTDLIAEGAFDEKQFRDKLEEEFRIKPADRPRRAFKFTGSPKARPGESLSDATAVRVGMTNNSLYAYVADGVNGLKVLQLTSDETPGFNGFSPIPCPKFIARYPTHGRAVSLSKGLDRDRAVDESGHQLSVFGRRGARPFYLDEQRRMFLRDRTNSASAVWRVSDEPAQAMDVSEAKK